MKQLLGIALGGALGALSRYSVSIAMKHLFPGHAMPWATLTVNVVGSFFIGLLSLLLVEKWPVSATIRLALLTGFLGALTTFSTFSLETLQLLQRGQMESAIVNIILNVTLSLLAVWSGWQLGRWMI
ncbi:fluoride efflux transporter CrcB [Magnetococcales bacterium HHB-1]